MGFENFSSNSLYLTRHPIFDSNLVTDHYELQYRIGLDSLTEADKEFIKKGVLGETDISTLRVFSNVFFDIGIPIVTENKIASINFTPNLIINDYWHEFPAEKVIFQLVLEGTPTKDLIRKCQEMVNLGYKLAINNFVLKKLTK